jgi:hypothetical protein
MHWNEIIIPCNGQESILHRELRKACDWPAKDFIVN